jgi:hypothetical protein
MGVGGEDALYQALNLKASMASKKKFHQPHLLTFPLL